MANSPAEFQAALTRLLDDPDPAEALGHKAPDLAHARFSPDTVAHGFYQAIEVALPSPGAKRP
jgi:hypothetical protein